LIIDETIKWLAFVVGLVILIAFLFMFFQAMYPESGMIFMG